MNSFDSDKVNLQFKYFHFVATFFTLSFILSNILASKIASLWLLDFPAGMVTFPLSYIFSDILTEVYGFQRARQVLWFTIFCEFFVLFFIISAVLLPSATFWHQQAEYQLILLPQIRIIFASCVAYFLGDFINNKIISKLKLRHGNNFIKTRFIGSTAVGVLVDNSTFTLLAYSGSFLNANHIPFKEMWWLIFGQYVIKVTYEALMSPISVRISLWLKKSEKIDVYDTKTNYSIFKFSVDDSQHVNKSF